MLIAVLTISCACKAQLYSCDSLKLYSFNPEKKLIFQYADTLITPRYDNSVLKIPKPELTYKSNSNGFDIYQSTPDNMYLIKPDSTIAFNMPVKKSTIQMKPIK